MRPIKVYYSCQELVLDSEEIFLELPQRDFRVLVSEQDEFFLEDIQGDINLDDGIDDLIKIKIKKTLQ